MQNQEELVAMLDKMEEQMNDIRNRVKIIESNNRRITEDIPKTLEMMQKLNKQIDEMKELVSYNETKFKNVTINTKQENKCLQNSLKNFLA